MTPDLLDCLVCPDCRGEISLTLSNERRENGDIDAGRLACPACGRSWPIRDGIPRFVEGAEDYSENFAYEWQRWGRVQIDRFANHRLSTTRFLADSRWPAEWIKGKPILDAVITVRPPPKRIRIDNGQEFVSSALDRRAYERGVTHFSRPGQ